LCDVTLRHTSEEIILYSGLPYFGLVHLSVFERTLDMFPPSCERWEMYAALGPSETVDSYHWTKSKNSVIPNCMYHRRKPLVIIIATGWEPQISLCKFSYETVVIPLKHKFPIVNNFKKNQFLPHRKHTIKSNWLLLFREITDVCSIKYPNYISTVYGRNAEIINVKVSSTINSNCTSESQVFWCVMYVRVCMYVCVCGWKLL
jgi:hypothetical protein